jgi:hypothetical protein
MPGGVWRLVVPDLRVLATRYLESNRPDAAEEFMSESGLGRRGLRRRGSELVRVLGNSVHLWMWDFESLSDRLRSHGFTAIRRADFGDSEYLAFSEVENSSRWIDAVGVECRRPS